MRLALCLAVRSSDRLGPRGAATAVLAARVDGRNGIVKTASWLLALSTLVAAPAMAVDGVIEINQARALAGGVTPGDTPGFPVSLYDSGSYRLTSDLELLTENTDGIEIRADDITLDLGGFAIRGPVTCQFVAGPDVTCSVLGGGEGIYDTISFGNDNLVIRNGTVKGVGQNGILLRGARVTIEDVRVEQNGNFGIVVTGLFSSVRNCMAFLNRESGVSTGSSSRVEGCVAHSNGRYGIEAGTATLVIRNAANGNAFDGINGSSLHVAGNSTQGNQQDGIDADGNSSIIGNTSTQNAQAGVICFGGTCNVLDNTLIGNGVAQLWFGAGGYARNVLVGTTTVIGTAVQTGPNDCNGSTTCP